jgi:hypothetical protein
MALRVHTSHISGFAYWIYGSDDNATSVRAGLTQVFATGKSPHSNQAQTLRLANSTLLAALSKGAHVAVVSSF